MSKLHLNEQRWASNIIGMPQDWHNWPVLPLTRPLGSQAEIELGVLVDLFHWQGIPGYSATVFLWNIYELPVGIVNQQGGEQEIAALLGLPKEVYDSTEEIVAAGWRPDR